MPKEKRICFDCAHFFLATMEEVTEFGICLNDEEFEPFFEELIENSNYDSCKGLIDQKKFDGEQEACGDFEEIESIEIDDNSHLGREILHLMQAGELTPESFEQALFEERISNIDWTTMPVERYEAQLKHPSSPEKRSEAISSLYCMISLGNKEAFRVLFHFFVELPLPKTLNEVHFKKELLRHLERSDTRAILLPYLIDELYRTPSNNTTRQWISDIFRFLEYSPIELSREPLEKMIKDKRFSYRLKKKMRDILSQREYHPN